MHTVNKLLYLTSSFFAGFALMTFELVSSRWMNPIVGSSVITWTTVIGATILGLSIGALTGGIIADKYPTKKTLSLAFLTSSLLIAIIPVITPLVKTLILFDISVYLITTLITFILFLPSAIALGALQPIILKLYAQDFERLGKQYGLISAAWSLGSILGVFLTGYFFVATIGSTQTLLVLSLVLILFSALHNYSKQVLTISIVALAIGGITGFASFEHFNPSSSDQTSVFKKETMYYAIEINETKPPYSEGRILFLDFDSHSITTVNHPNEYYTEIYPVFGVFKPTIANIHVMGAGAYTLPKDLSEYYGASISVSEIDRELIAVGEKFFNLDTNKITTIISDSRVFLNRTNERFDLIFGDVFSSFISVPWHLMTKEFNTLAKSRLSDGGIYALNFIGALNGPYAPIFHSVLNTFTQTFPTHYVFAFGTTETEIQNIVLVGLNGDRGPSVHELRQNILEGQYGSVLSLKLKDIDEQNLQNTLILRDNFAPAEQLLIPAVRGYFHTYVTFLQKIRGV